MRREEFEVDKEFYTACGLWICTGTSDTEIRAKQLWRYTTSGNESIENAPEVTFNNRHWPACRAEKPRIVKGEKPRKIPCFRCYNDDPDVPRTILDVMGFETTDGVSIFRGTTTVVCVRCRRNNEQSGLRFGKYKWICPCGANIWHDDPNTDEKCRCGRERGFWTPTND